MERAAQTLAVYKNKAAAATLKTPPVYEYFDCVQKGKHTVESRDGTTKDVPCEWYRCKKHGSGCKVKGSPPIKVVKKATSGLLKHLRICEGEERWLEVRVDSKGSAVFKGTDGALVVKLTFKELLPHHVQFVIYCFRAFDKFSKTRNKDFLAYIEGWEVRARLPARETCIKILFVIKHLVKRRLHSLLSLIKQMLGSPFIGYLDDIWSKVNCKQSFACARIPMAIDGELLDKFLASLFPAHRPQYTGTIVSCSPVLAFSTLPSSRHTGHVIARWKLGTLKDTQVLESKDVSLATEDGASNNKKSNKLLRWPSLVCFPHNLQRCVLIGAGLAGKPCRNAALKKFQARSGKMVGSFSKSGVATAALVEAQIEDDGWDRVLTLASPNVTRWLGLHRQAMRNRELQPNICTALCGDEKGKDSDDEDEDAGAEGLSSSGSEGSGDEDLPRALAVNNNESDESDDGDRIEANVRANKAFPLAHRLLTQSEFTHNAQFESCLVSPAEVSGLLQSHDGLGLEEAQLLMITLAQQTEAPRMQVVSGRGASESWDEVPASRLHQMFKDFRSIFVEEANTRFSLKGTPNEHILLTLKMSPFVDTSPEGPFGKRATQELMQAIYMTKLRARQQYLLSKEAATAAAVPAAAVPATTSGAAASASPSGATPPPPSLPLELRQVALRRSGRRLVLWPWRCTRRPRLRWPALRRSCTTRWPPTRRLLQQLTRASTLTRTAVASISTSSGPTTRRRCPSTTTSTLAIVAASALHRPPSRLSTQEPPSSPPRRTISVTTCWRPTSSCTITGSLSSCALPSRRSSTSTRRFMAIRHPKRRATARATSRATAMAQKERERERKEANRQSELISNGPHRDLSNAGPVRCGTDQTLSGAGRSSGGD